MNELMKLNGRENAAYSRRFRIEVVQSFSLFSYTRSTVIFWISNHERRAGTRASTISAFALSWPRRSGFGELVQIPRLQGFHMLPSDSGSGL